MISLETAQKLKEVAQKLKEAGLEWKPGDLCYDRYGRPGIVTQTWGHGAIQMYSLETNTIEYGFGDSCTVVPRLDRLLAEIEKRGWAWHLMWLTEGNKTTSYHCYIVMPDASESQKGQHHIQEYDFEGGTPEEAVAEALLWILEKERGSK